MSANNFNTLDEEFNEEMFNAEQHTYKAIDDSLLLSDPELERQLGGSDNNNANNKEEDVQMSEASPPEKKKKKRRNNKNDQFKLAVIGDSNLKSCDQYLEGILFKLATKLKDGQHRLTHALNEITQLKNVQTVVISALQNIVSDEGVHRWSSTVTKFVLRISTFATKRSDIHFVILAPFLRIRRENHGPLIKPITQQLRREFSAVPNVHVFDGFSASVEDLKPDGVHLKEESRERLFAVVQQCLQKDWTLPPPQNPSGACSEFSDLRRFLAHRNAPIRPPNRSRSRSPRFDNRNRAPPSHVPQRSRSPLRYQAQSRPQRSQDERRYSGPVRRSRSRSRSPIINTIARLDRAHYEMFGRYPNMEDYFPHRQNNNESRPPLSASGPGRRLLSLDYRPPRSPSGPGRRQLSSNDLRHHLHCREDNRRGSERF